MADGVSVVAARLAGVVPRAVYEHAVPRPPADAYLWVYGGVPIAESRDLSDGYTVQAQTVWVVSCSRDRAPEVAAGEAAWGAAAAAEALRGWRPPLPGASLVVPLAAQPAARDEDLPGETVFFAAATYVVQYQIVPA